MRNIVKDDDSFDEEKLHCANTDPCNRNAITISDESQIV